MNLPEDIVLEILSSLPVRSLIRYKCVSKKWYALIESSRFVDMHLTFQLAKGDEHIQTLRGINGLTPWTRHVVTRFDNLESLSCSTPPDVEVPGYQYSDVYTDVQFATHSNGIVCMFDCYRRKITLWNPALREFRMLPHRPFQFPCGFDGGFAVGIGFGFDDATNEYKVVCVEQFMKDDNTIEVVQVYNLKSNSWRRLETIPDQLVPEDVAACYSSIFFKGSVHWLVWTILRQPLFILAFNITTELFCELQCPHGWEDWDALSRIFILDKSTLSMVVDFTPTGSRQQMDVWVMNDYNVKDSWTKRYSITPGSNDLCPLSFWKKDKLLLLTTDGVWICYDLQTCQRHHILHYAAGNYSTLNVVVCVETLVSIR